MYKLSPTPKCTYNVAFLLNFKRKECAQYVRSGHDIINTWWGHPEKFRTYTHGMYATTSLDIHMLYVPMILFHLIGKKSVIGQIGRCGH
jgi:hypothetical protein